MAVGLAAELLESSGLSATLVVGDKGIFDVTLDKKLIFSKHQVNRFPLLGEVTETLRGEELCMKNE